MTDQPIIPTHAGFDEIMSRHPAKIQELAYAARALIYRVYPEVVEVTWVHQGNAGYGVGPKKMSEHFSWISSHTQHIDFGFFYGATLPDPQHLLEGTGKLLRHVKIRKVEDVHNPALQALLEAAVEERKRALGKV